MQISQLKKLLHPIKELTSRRAKRSSAETSESREESEVQSDKCRVMSDESLVNSLDEAVLEPMCEENAPVAEENKPCEELSETPSPTVNTKAHLSSSVPRAAKLPQGVLTKGQMAEIRSIFGDMDDAEIQRLYKRVTK